MRRGIAKRLDLGFGARALPVLMAALGLAPGPALAVAGPGAGATAAAKRGKPQLSVRKVSSPPAAVAAGERIKLTGKLRNRGRRAGRGQMRLIIPREAGATGGAPLAKKLSRRVEPGKQRSFGFRFRVPGRLAPEPGGDGVEHALAACVRRHGQHGRYRCRELRRPLRIPAGPGPAPLPPRFEPGAQTIGDPLFPQIGNGGYDVGHYLIELDYDPAANRLRRGTRARITATATQDLGRFSLDFQDLAVSSVTVNGAEAVFSQRRATPRLEGATQPIKLIVDPSEGIPSGSQFSVEIAYSGAPVQMTDPDGSSEGWLRACVGAPRPATCDGSFVVNEPNGAQGWFPGNNHPSDKASFETRITAPAGKPAIGIGELASRTVNGDGTRTWTWVEDDPTATYLTTATVGDFVFAQSSIQAAAPPRTLPVYEAIDRVATPPQRDSINEALDRTEGMIDFLAARFGPYPFDSTGAVVDNVPRLGYALEVQTRPLFASLSVDPGTLLHEHAHQWFGNSVSPATWLEIWFNEGWAEWSTWYWEHEDGIASESPAEQFDRRYAEASAAQWAVPPATLDRDPANLFAPFPVYNRSAMTLQGYREIVGDGRFFAFARELQSRYGHSNVSTAQVLDLAAEVSGLDGERLPRLERFFGQWLYGDTKPTLLPEDV